MNLSTEKKLYKRGETIAKRFFYCYRNLFQANSIDKNDLTQEAALTVWKILRDYNAKPPDELIKIIHKAVKNTLLRQKEKCSLESKHIINLQQSEEFKNSADPMTYEKYLSTMPGATIPPVLPELFYNEAMNTCTPIERELLSKRFIEKKTLEAIGLECGFSKNGARFKIESAMRKIRKKFPNLRNTL